MNPQTFFDHFERLTDASGSVPRLRELILQFAVQGRLVEQDERDEPAARLLARIEAERKQLFEKSVNGDDTSLPEDILLPRGWQFEKLGNLASAITKGSTPTTYGYKFQKEGVHFVKVENVKNGRIVTERIKDFISEEAHQSQKRSQLAVGDILFSIAGTIGETCVVKEVDLPANTNQALAIIRGTKQVFLPAFLKLQLDSFVANAVRSRARGGAMNNVSLGDLKELMVFVPPLKEQKRIIAKVDELMRLCDELERVQAERREARHRLNRTALDGLLAARDAAEFQARWQTISDHFPTLTAAPDQIGKLRQTVLQLAVQGKLTRQDPRDEPASVLFQRICAERERLVKEKKLKRADPLPPVNPDETPFALPNGWTWTYLDAMSNAIHYGYTASANPSLKDIRLLRITDIQNGNVDWDSVPGCEIDEKALPSFELNDSDILIARTGGTIGKSYLVEDLLVRAVFASYLIRVVPNSISYPPFIKLFLESDLYWTQLRAKSMGTGQPNVNATSLKSLLLPFPSLEEQKRIVAAVNRLMALCDEMEVGLRRTEEDGERLLRAAVRSLLSPTPENSRRMPALA